MVFLDLILPGKSGIEVLEALQRVGPKTRVVVITAVDQSEADRQLSDKNIHAILRKPISFGDLKTLMASLTYGPDNAELPGITPRRNRRRRLRGMALFRLKPPLTPP